MKLIPSFIKRSKGFSPITQTAITTLEADVISLQNREAEVYKVVDHNVFAVMTLANDAERKRLSSRASHIVFSTLSTDLYRKFRWMDLKVNHPFKLMFTKITIFVLTISIVASFAIGLAVKVPELFAKSLAEQYETAMVKKESASSLDDKMTANKQITAYNQSWEKYPKKRGSFKQIDRISIDKADYVKAEHFRLVALSEKADIAKATPPSCMSLCYESNVAEKNEIIEQYNVALGKATEEEKGDLKKVEYLKTR